MSFKWPPVLIVWQDSATSHGWDEPNKPVEPSVIRTIGFLVHHTPGKRGIHRIASSEDDRYVNGIIEIPNVCILDYYDLDVEGVD